MRLYADDGEVRDILFSEMPTRRFLIFQPSPLTAGRGLRISMDWLPCTLTIDKSILVGIMALGSAHSTVGIELGETGRASATSHELAEVDDVLAST